MNSKGFTLLELIVVMVIIAMTVSFTAPQIDNFLYADQLKTAVRKLVGLINQSSQLALQRQIPYLLTYTEGDRRFAVVPEWGAREGEGSGGGAELRLGDEVTVKDIWSLYGGTRSVEAFSVRFTKNGYVEPTIIHLWKEGGQDFSIVLTPFLGKIQVVDGYVNPDATGYF